MLSLPARPFRPHRRLARSVAALVLACSAVSALPAQSMFRGDAAHSGLYATEAPAALKGVRWRFATGGPVISSPVLADGTLFVGSDDKHLHAIDAATGAARWKFATEGRVRSTAAVAGGLVYFSSYDGNVYAVAAATGELRWKYATEGERHFTAPGLHGYQPRRQPIPDFWDCYQSSPVVAGGLVYLGSGDGHLYALDAASGALRWKFKTGNVVHSSPALADGLVVFGSWDTHLYALDAATGEMRWKFKTGDDAVNFNQTGIQSSPCIQDGTVYFGCRDSHLYAVDLRTGREKWKYKLTWINASPAVRDGRVYACSSIPAHFFALDAATGAELYKLDAQIPAFSSPALAGNYAFFGSFNGRLSAVDLAAGRIAWQFQTESSKANVAGVLTPEGGFNPKVAFTSDSFENMYVTADRLLSLGSILSSPLVDRGVVYVGSADGSLYALE